MVILHLITTTSLPITSSRRPRESTTTNDRSDHSAQTSCVKVYLGCTSSVTSPCKQSKERKDADGIVDVGIGRATVTKIIFLSSVTIVVVVLQ
eukprot:scaffold2040_cov196-Alexandrium_tamarense.AAC.9